MFLSSPNNNLLINIGLYFIVFSLKPTKLLLVLYVINLLDMILVYYAQFFKLVLVQLTKETESVT